MQILSKTLWIVLSSLILFALASCSSPVQEATTPTQDPVPPTVEIAEQSEPALTTIIIDGLHDDWEGLTERQDDAIGDAEEGFLDFEYGYVFLNQDALYFIVLPVDPASTFVSFDVQFYADDRNLQISWGVGADSGVLGDYTSEGVQIGPTQYSLFAYDHGFEGRIDLRDIGNPSTVELRSLNAMAGSESTWRQVDLWEPGETVFINARDAASAREANEPTPSDQSTIETDEPTPPDQLQLPDGYAFEFIFAPPLPDVDEIVRSGDGVVFVHQAGINPGVSTLDPVTGEVNRIFDYLDEESGAIVGGPRESAFITIRGGILQLFANGDVERWGDLGPGWPKHYTEGGRMLAISHDETMVMELLPDGSFLDIASGFNRIDGVVMNSEGVLFLSEVEEGNIVRIDPDGTRRNLLSGIVYRDFTRVGLDLDENLWIASPHIGIAQVDTESGKYSSIGGFPGAFVFTAPGELLVVRYLEVNKIDLNSKTGKLLVEGRGIYTRAVDIGPDDELYLGTTGSEETPGQVVKFGDDGSEEILLDGLSPNMIDISFDEDGDLYIAANLDGIDRVYFYPHEGGDVRQITDNVGTISSIAADPIHNSLWIAGPEGELYEYSAEGLVTAYDIELPEPVLNFRIDIAPDGTLYASAAEAARMITGPVVKRWILRLEPLLGKSEIIAQYDHDGSGAWDFLGVDPLGNIWWITNPDSDLLKVTPDGSMELFASNLPIDCPGVIADSSGDIYLLTSSGILRIFEQP